MVSQKEQGLFFMEQLVEIHANANHPKVEKYTMNLKSLLEDIAKERTSTVAVQFSNLFSRLTFLSKQLQLPKSLQRELHYFRVESRKIKKQLNRGYSVEKMFSIAKYNYAISSIARFLAAAYEIEIPTELNKIVEEFQQKQEDFEEKKEPQITYEKIRVVLTRKDEDRLWCQDEENLFLDEIEVDCKHLDVRWFWEGAQLLLLNCKTTDYKIYRPSFIILEPDYLVDVSGIANCFKDIGKNPGAQGFSVFHFIRRFMPMAKSKPIFLGNVVNDLFDEQINDFEGAKFKELFMKTFKKYPLEYVTTPGMDQTFMKDAESHFFTLQKVLKDDFKTIGIETLSDAITEPSFISADYGLQGRLDLLSSENDKTNIVELKSGKLFSLKAGGINLNYHAQALLYKYLISSVWKKDTETIDTYILFSKPMSQQKEIKGLEQKQLRYAVPYKELESELFNVRNRIVALDYKLANDSLEGIEKLFRGLQLKFIEDKMEIRFPHFFHNDFHDLQNTLFKSTLMEKAYFYKFAQFIAKEQFLAKLGSPSLETDRGFARLWQADFPNNMDDSILQGLSVDDEEDIKIHESAKIIKFQRPFQETEVNFREGDLCILYASDTDADLVTNQQVFKCFIQRITKEEVELRFRNRQAKTLFLEKKQWTMVPDFMEVGFTMMYQNIYSFLGQSVDKKQLWFGLRRPSVSELSYQEELTKLDGELINEQQENVIKKMMQAKDYFFLVGPPGTGKTSTVLKHLVRELYKDKEQNILVLAYTNRAVDEISEAVDQAIGHIEKITPQNFIRLGSELSTGEKYRPNLLGNLPFTSRRELVPIINEHRVFVSTIATFSNRQDLLDLKTFDTVIIDEASQILEPQIIGTLSLFKKVILIGDEKQLPAISTQDSSFAEIEEEREDIDLRKIGLTNLKNSLFERMLTTCKKNEWTDCYDTLTTQYRMHGDISEFPNVTFYKGLLNVGVAPHQLENNLYTEFEEEHYLENLVANNRMLFFPSKTNQEDKSLKVNTYEARLVSQLVQQVKTLYKKNKLAFDPAKTVGVITPFRSQIAQIKKQLEEDGIENYEKIIVDTVERFQGSQRDIIIISLCMNSGYQVNNLSNSVEIEEEGENLIVDRKLNVAMTRAKKQQFIIGNDYLLSSELVNFQMVEYMKTQGQYVAVGIDNLLTNKKLINPALFLETNVFKPTKDFEKVFTHLVESPLQKHRKTKNNLLLGNDDCVNRNMVLKYGRTNFETNSLFGHKPVDKVNLYCHYYLLKNYAASYAFCEREAELFADLFSLTNHKVTLIDMGCGTMTMGLAFGQAFKKVDFHYIGIDVAKEMIEKAKLFSRTTLFQGQSAKFYDSFDQIEELDQEKQTIVFNFSFMLTLLTREMVEELIQDIKGFMEGFSNHKYLFIYQDLQKNTKYNFSIIKKELELEQKGSGAFNVHVINDMNAYDTTQTVSYEIIS